MIQICCACKRLLCEGDKVAFEGTSTYHVLKSKIVFALDRDNMEIDPDTLGHIVCPD